MLQGFRVLVGFEVLKPMHGADGEHTFFADIFRQMFQHQLAEFVQHSGCILVRKDDDRVRDGAGFPFSPQPFQAIRYRDIGKRVGNRCNGLIKAEAAGDLQLTFWVRERI